MFKILEHLRGRSGYNRKGEELPDPVPTQLHIDIEAEMPLHEKVLRAVQSSEWTRRMNEQGIETYEEANDFDIPDDLGDPRSIHEEQSGDMLAYEEGVRSGFVEEIPKERKEAAGDAVRTAIQHMRDVRKAARELRREKPPLREVLHDLSDLSKGELK